MSLLEKRKGNEKDRRKEGRETGKDRSESLQTEACRDSEFLHHQQVPLYNYYIITLHHTIIHCYFSLFCTSTLDAVVL